MKRSTDKSYIFIRKNRFRKKLNMYKRAIGVMIDKTIAFYLLILVGYTLAGFFMLGDFINAFNEQFLFIEEQAIANVWLIVTILPLRYIMQSFSKPGILLSTSEYQLTMLPHALHHVWFLSVLEKWFKNILIYLLIGILVVGFTPISLSTVIFYFFLFVVMDVLMTIPQWKLFQTRLLTKICWVGALLLVNL